MHTPRCHLSLKKLISSGQVINPRVVDGALCSEVTVSFIIFGDKVGRLLHSSLSSSSVQRPALAFVGTEARLGFREPWFALSKGHLKLNDLPRPGRTNGPTGHLFFTNFDSSKWTLLKKYSAFKHSLVNEATYRGCNSSAAT